MKSPTASILRQVNRSNNKYNILTFPTHERYQNNLSKIDHNYYLWHGPNIKTWNSKYGKVPHNHTLLNGVKQIHQLPAHIDFDMILCQSTGGQLQVSQQLSKLLHIPRIGLEHTTVPPQYSKDQLLEIKKHTKADINIFISDYNRKQWLYDENESKIIHHCIDTEIFNNNITKERKNHILTVANEYISRDWCLGFSIYKRITDGLPTCPVGDTPGLSQPASSIEELVNFYQTSRIFLNTSTFSPIPTSMLEAMACGCAIVSNATCMIPEIIENGVNGFLSTDENKLREYLHILLTDDKLADTMGRKAQQTIAQYFGVSQFIQQWTDTFNIAAQSIFRG